LTISKPTPVTPLYDATGRWNFNLSNISYNCGDGPEQTSGYFDVVQTGNKITAVDNLGHEYNGFVDGTQYTVLRSYSRNGGRNTDFARIALSSATQGAGKAGFVWDDDSGECWGDWNISMTKEIPDHTITASAGPGGSISPSGLVSVNDGANQSFQIIPDFGYIIIDVKVDGASVGKVSSYTFSNVSSDHTIEAIFTKLPKAMPWIPLLLLDD